ncbi:Fic family protein [Methylobacterium sp. EM32]|uniref:Fic family protein n=1 Tax=Methylobacterium sp. EM32 TaxID=3163481 RepID=UPI0033AD89AF
MMLFGDLILPDGTSPVGYAALVQQLELSVAPHYRSSYVTPKGAAREIHSDGSAIYIYPISYSRGETIGDQLEFAIKYDGINLEILASVFKIIEEEHILSYINRAPTGKYSRKIWFLYEFLTDRRLPLADLKTGNYIEILEADKYYTSQIIRNPRQRINNNLLGTRQFCPIVRRTDILKRDEELNLDSKVIEILRKYDDDTVNRAISYMYTKETLSSFLIERETPSQDRAERFAAMLKRAASYADLTHDMILEARNLIVDEKYRVTGYRSDEVYVGENLSYLHQKVHFVGAAAQHVTDMMEGLVSCYRQMRISEVHAVIVAAAVSFGFVFIHPFDDGNGRTHRFLIHYILSKMGFTPEGLIFPVSSAILNNMRDYDECLERFSVPIMGLVKYQLDEDGVIKLQYSPEFSYRYFDATVIAEYLFYCIQATIAIDFVQQLDFMVAYRETRNALKDASDMPDKKIDLFIRFYLQNGGKLSKTKLARHFSELSEDKVARFSDIVKSNMGGSAAAFDAQPGSMSLR